MSDEARARSARRWLVGVAFLLASYFIPGASWSPVSRFCLTRAIVEHGSFEITPYAASTGDRAQVEERFFTDKAPVPSLLAVPAYAVFYAVGKARHHLPAFRAEGPPSDPARRVLPSPAFTAGLYACSVMTAAVALAGLAWALFEVLSRRVSREAAALGTLATVLGTPLFPYATSFFDHTIAASLLFGAFALTDPLGARAGERRRTILAGALLALAAGTQYIAAAPAVIVAACAVLRDRRRAFAHLAAGAILPLAVLGAYHAACFGLPFRTGYAFVTHPAFAGGQSTGLFGITWPHLGALFALLFGRSRGLFYVSPMLLFAVAAMIGQWKKRADPSLFVGALVFGTLLLVNASYYLWNGGRALGPRHLVPALGFLGVGVGYAFERHRSLAAVLAGISVTIMLLGTAVGLEAPAVDDVIFDYIVPALREGRIARAPGASNWGLAMGFSPRGSVVPAAVLAALAFAMTSALSTPEKDKKRDR